MGFLKNKRNILNFENLFAKYCKSNDVSESIIDLSKVYDKFEKRADKLRIFYAFLDLKISLTFQELNMLKIIKDINDYTTKKYSQLELLGSEKKFNTRIKILNETNTFILRHRSIWDKFFGVIVLSLWPKDYDTFIKSKSKRKAFLKLFNQNGASEESLNMFKKILTDFENMYRTPEMHGPSII